MAQQNLPVFNINNANANAGANAWGGFATPWIAMQNDIYVITQVKFFAFRVIKGQQRKEIFAFNYNSNFFIHSFIH